MAARYRQAGWQGGHIQPGPAVMRRVREVEERYLIARRTAQMMFDCMKLN